MEVRFCASGLQSQAGFRSAWEKKCYGNTQGRVNKHVACSLRGPDVKYARVESNPLKFHTGLFFPGAPEPRHPEKTLWGFFVLFSHVHLPIHDLVHLILTCTPPVVLANLFRLCYITQR